MNETIIAMRDTLLPKLLEAGVDQVICKYEGEGDSGGISELDLYANEVNVTNDEAPRTLLNELTLLMDEIISIKHGGYENNDGGNGEIIWSLKGENGGDISVECNDVITDIETDTYEGWDVQ
jgi:hypothetical protein